MAIGSDTKVFALRMTTALHATIKDRAQVNRRSMNSEILALIETALGSPYREVGVGSADRRTVPGELDGPSPVLAAKRAAYHQARQSVEKPENPEI